MVKVHIHKVNLFKMPLRIEVKTLRRKNDQLLSTRKLGDQKKVNVLQTVLKCAAYQKEQNNSELPSSRRNPVSISLISVIDDNSSLK